MDNELETLRRRVDELERWKDAAFFTLPEMLDDYVVENWLGVKHRVGVGISHTDIANALDAHICKVAESMPCP